MERAACGLQVTYTYVEYSFVGVERVVVEVWRFRVVIMYRRD